jgi:hypothetical protein
MYHPANIYDKVYRADDLIWFGMVHLRVPGRDIKLLLRGGQLAAAGGKWGEQIIAKTRMDAKEGMTSKSELGYVVSFHPGPTPVE